MMADGQPAGENLSIRRVLPWMGVALLGSVLPYLAGWLFTPDGMVFTGGLINPVDLSVYLSAMRQGQAGGWLFEFTFSPETIPPRLTYLLYLLLGRLASITRLSMLALFQTTRLLLSGITLSILVFWVRQVFTGNTGRQWTAWLLVVFGSGSGWLLVYFPAIGLALLPDVNTPEWTTMFAMLNTPHFVLGVGLEALLMGCVLRMEQAPDGFGWAGAGALASLGVALIYPYNISIVGLIIGLYMLSLAIQAGKIPWRSWLQGAVVLLPLLPFLFYYGIWARRDPNWEATHVLGNVIEPPPLPGMMIGLGVLGLFALAGLWRWRDHQKRWLVPIWAVANLGCLYLPLPFSGRFALGIMVPVGTLAAFGLEQVVLPFLHGTVFFERFSRLTSTPAETLWRVAMLVTVPSTLLLILRLVSIPLNTPTYPSYMPAGEVQAMQWLRDHTDEQALILAYLPVGNHLPGYINGKVFAGQPFLTLELDEKIAQIETFWDADTSLQWREDFLREWGITHIYQGYYENQLTTDAVAIPGTIVYQANDVTIYQVTTP